jgi:hypothetical protein
MTGTNLGSSCDASERRKEDLPILAGPRIKILRFALMDLIAESISLCQKCC